MELIDPTAGVEFAKGKIVFRIVALAGKKKRDIGMVNSNKDFERKLKTHLYNPLLFMAPLWIQLAYIFGCLNHEYQKQREETFVFLWRRLNTDEWYKWFVVHPYVDSIY